jgi:hypothetical protein
VENALAARILWIKTTNPSSDTIEFFSRSVDTLNTDMIIGGFQMIVACP